MPERIFKQVDEQVTYAFEFKNRLAFGAVLSSGTVAATDTSDSSDVTSTLLSSATSTISGTQARFRIIAGTAGRTYRITMKATLDNGDLLEEDVLFTIAAIT